MSDKTFEGSDFNNAPPFTVRNLALSVSALLVVVVAGILLQPVIAQRMSEAAIRSEPAISPVEEAEKFSPEWYAWHR